MFIYTYTETEGSESRRVAGDIDHILKPAFGDRPGANGHQGTGPRLSARMLQEYEAARRELINGIITEDMIQLVNVDDYCVGLNVKSPCGLTLCHAVRGNTVGARIDIEELHYHQQWSGAPMEVIDRSRVVESSLVFLQHAEQWREQLTDAFKADSKGVKMRNMAMNNIDVYLERYFDGTGITYHLDKRHADGHKARLLIHLNRYKTLDLPIPHDDFINHLDLIKPYMVARCATTGKSLPPPSPQHKTRRHSLTASRAGCTVCLTAATTNPSRRPRHRCSNRLTNSSRARNANTASSRKRAMSKRR